jgi:acetoin utilization protein AcuB
MIVSDIMTTKVITADMDDTLTKIQKVFEKNRFHHIPVLNGGKVVGIVSDRVLLREISPFIHAPSANNRDFNTMKRKAHQVMVRDVKCVAKEASVEEAAEVLLTERINCLLVLSDSGHIDGMVTTKDVLRHFIGAATSLHSNT